MPVVIEPTTRFRRVLPWVIGLTVWGLSLALMVQGLWVGAWYGFALAMMFVAFGGVLLGMFWRGRKLMLREVERICREGSE
ncbi:MAG TPA: hypothetical protein VH253_13180 [Phycisphaerae bacterium]|nr:hypothetical protein [Phycisphaerae bacterium]